jgi:hypothetical protein
MPSSRSAESALMNRDSRRADAAHRAGLLCKTLRDQSGGVRTRGSRVTAIASPAGRRCAAVSAPL